GGEGTPAGNPHPRVAPRRGRGNESRLRRGRALVPARRGAALGDGDAQARRLGRARPRRPARRGGKRGLVPARRGGGIVRGRVAGRTRLPRGTRRPRQRRAGNDAAAASSPTRQRPGCPGAAAARGLTRETRDEIRDTRYEIPVGVFRTSYLVSRISYLVSRTSYLVLLQPDDHERRRSEEH